MIEHLIIWLKTPPKQIAIGSTPETGRWKFINQHGDVGRLNKVNLARLYRSEAESKGFFHKKHVVIHPLVGVFQGSIGISQKSLGDFLPQDIVEPEFVHVLCLHDGTFEVIHQRLFLVPIVFAKQDKNSFRVGFLINDANTDLSLPRGIFQMWVESSVANHECLNQSRVKNGIDGLMQNSTHTLHCNPKMTYGLITKRALTLLTSI
ncbi:uncharacterized protein TNCV_2367831 [Trichonephila clavipes]|nr:uncharacterized protein TNCV_2367831 [Trichonephila clavipes]